VVCDEKNDDIVATQALQLKLLQNNSRGRPKNTGKEIWRKKCGLKVLGTAGRRWRRQHKIELDEDKWHSAIVDHRAII